jgi:hypothetical protein
MSPAGNLERDCRGEHGLGGPLGADRNTRALTGAERVAREEVYSPIVPVLPYIRRFMTA